MRSASYKMTDEPEYSKRETFTSYVVPGDTLNITSEQILKENEWCVPSDKRNVMHCEPKLIPNEQIVASAPAYLCTAYDPIDVEEAAYTNRKLVLGLLTVTNFRLSFVPLTEQRHALTATDLYQRNPYLQQNDVTLNNIDHIYRVTKGSRTANALSGGGNKRKKVDSQQQKVIHGRISALHVICKNFRMLKFGFQQSTSSRDHGYLILSALMRFVFISSHELTFTCFYKEPYYPTPNKSTIAMYTTQNDWVREIIRCGATGRWRVYSKKVQSDSDSSLPPHFVIPHCIKDEEFLKLSRAFYDNRAPFWVYEYGTASLVRVAELRPDTQQNTTAENIALEIVRKCNEKLKLHRMQLTDCLPSIQDVQRAYHKLQRLCTPEDWQQFLIQDSKFLTLLEKSNWLFYVSLCLRYACEAAEKLRSDMSCVLQETRGRDLCCVVSSLIQIILDPLYRTIDGFQSLVQKEWIALEHPFRTRLGHANSTSESAEDSESPIFLLFLDCVWQLLQQFPDEFEYSQTYLTTVWDTCFMPIFDTFQFDSNAERNAAVKKGILVLRPVWDWREQFSERDSLITFFNNPFYQRHRQEAHSRRSMATPPSVAAHKLSHVHRYSEQNFNINPQMFATKSTVPKDRFLKPTYHISSLQIWEQCYFRWMPVLEIVNGGFPQIDLHHRLLLNNIAKLQRALELEDYSDLPDIYYQMTGEEREAHPDSLAHNDESVDHADDSVSQVECRKIEKDGIGLTNINTLQLPSLSSFFPFSINAEEIQQQQLNDILTDSREYLLDGSIMDRLSIA